MKRYFAAILALSLGFVSICFSVESSTEKPEGVEPDVVEVPDIRAAAAAEVLVIKDGNPWNANGNEQALSDLGKSYDVMNTSSLATTDLSGYQIVIIASDQSTSTYNNLIANKAKLADYVSNGGVLLAHACDMGWRIGHWSSSFLPGGIGHVNTYQENLSIVDSTNLIVDGISDSELDGWNYSTHGYFTNLLAGTNIIIGITGNPTGQPTYIEYSWGNGSVLATMQTIEWPWASGQGTEELLLNEINYAQTLLCPEPPSHEPWSFVHITDSHIGFPGAREHIASAFDAISQLDPKPDFVLNTGDIVDSAWLEITSITFAREVYENYLEALEPLDDSGIEHYEVPGNHDRYVYGYFWLPIFPWDWIPDYFYSQDLSQYSACLEGAIDYSFEPEGKGFIFYGMNSGKDVAEGVHIEPLVFPPTPEELRGTGLTSEQMKELYKLDACKPKIIFMHHPAVHTEEGYVIANNRDNPGGFIEYCKTNNVQLVLTGHTHRSHILDADGTNIAPGTTLYPQFIQTPSVSDPKAWFISDDPGYRIVDVVNNKCYARAYSPLSPSDLLNIKLNTHANVHVYDTTGQHVGITASGQHERGIPRSFYFSPIVTDDGIKVLPEEIIIFNPFDDYRHKVVGVETGTYRLNITFESGGEACTFEAIDIPTSLGVCHVYVVDREALAAGEDDAVVLEIDTDGDGIPEKTVIADEDLTSEEFALQTETAIDFEPDVLNLRSPGKVITVYIELPEGFDVSEIVISSLELKSSVSALSKPVKIGDYDEDGTADLMVKFDRQQVIEILGSGTQMVTLTGQLSDGRPIAGIDFIRVIGSTKAEIVEPEFESIMPEEFIADMEESLQTTNDDTVDTGGEDAFNVEEAVVFMLFEASEIINELGSESFNNEESAFELACALDDVFTMLDEGMYFEVMVILQGHILERMDGCANTGEPDEDDWITSIEGQALLYPLLTETIELLESML